MLETEIKRLTAAITRLADLMEQQDSEGAAPVVEDAPAVDADPAPDAQPDQPAIDYRLKAKDLCLSLVRAKRSNKPLIAEWLDGKGAKTINGLKDPQVVEMVEFLEGFK